VFPSSLASLFASGRGYAARPHDNAGDCERKKRWQGHCRRWNSQDIVAVNS
jgi:hypothetical protein